MGTNYQAKLIVGLPQDEITVDDEGIFDHMDQACGYYDCDSDAIILGVTVASTNDYSASEVDIDLAKIDAAKVKFKELTGQEGKLYLSPHGY